MNRVRIGSRESPLAVFQAKQVISQIESAWPDISLELKTFKTKGDLILDTSLSKVGEKGLFVKELEEALYQNEIDLAVHSMKDMPGQMPEGLVLQSAGPREDPRDVLLATGHVMFQYLSVGAVIGTSSLRRTAQFRRLRSDLIYENIRGNLQTRYRKMEDGAYQGILLAAAGVHRLGWQQRIAQYFDPIEESIPAVGQGILGAEYREGDEKVKELLSSITLPEVEAAMTAERAVLQKLEGGCQVPIGAYARQHPENPEQFTLYGIILAPEGEDMIRSEKDFIAANAAEMGTNLAEELLMYGGREILEKVRALPGQSS